MGYTATSNLVWGIELTEEEEKQAKKDHLYDTIEGLKTDEEISDSIGMYFSGDGRSGLYNPILGILVGEGDEYSPHEIMNPVASEEEIEELKELCKNHNIEYRQPKLWLVTYII